MTNKIINIGKQKDSSITHDIGEITLGDYTIFAGNNNAGKTNLIKVIKKSLESEGIHVIHIPAERVIAEKEIDTSKQTDPMRQAIIDLVEVNFEVDKSIKSKIDDLKSVLPVNFSNYGVEKILLTVNTNEPKSEDYIKQIKDTYAKSLIESMTIRDDYSGKENVHISKVGQGTQRLIIASLIEYLSNKKNIDSGDIKTYLIFEEPEVYLHPMLKEKLYNNLLKLSERIGVIVSTHDPYFIQLGKDHPIFKVYRRKADGATWVDLMEKKYLYYNSYAETNYQIFDVASESYFLELYEQIKRTENIKGYSDFDDHIFKTYFSSKGDQQSCKSDEEVPRDIMPVTRLRHNIAHGKNGSAPITLKEATEKMIDFINDNS